MKKILCLLLTTFLMIGALSGCGSQTGTAKDSKGASGNTPVVLNEVAHSMEYPNKSNIES